MMKKTIPLLLAVLTLQGCNIYWHEGPYLRSASELLSKKSIAVCSLRMSNYHNYENKWADNGFRIVSYNEINTIAPYEFLKNAHVTPGTRKNTFSQEVLQRLKDQYGLDVIMYEESIFLKHLGLWSAFTRFTILDISTGKSLAAGYMDVAGALSKQAALDNVSNKVVNMIIYSSKSGKSWSYSRFPHWQ